MSNRTKLLLNETEPSDNKILSVLTVRIREDWSISTDLDKWEVDLETADKEILETSAKNVIEFFRNDLIPRAIRWNIDLWAPVKVLKHIIKWRIIESVNLLEMDAEEFNAIIKSCKEKGKI